jgi:hypothetical protein
MCRPPVIGIDFGTPLDAREIGRGASLARRGPAALARRRGDEFAATAQSWSA